MTVLVTGGAGYIGSHMVHALLDRGEDVVVVDDMRTGVRAALPPDVALVEGDVADETVLARAMEGGVDTVLHFAGSTIVPESVADPLKYYRNNTGATRALLAAAVERDVPHVVFSSTAAVYGITGAEPVAEDAPTLPIAPYGRSKLMSEWMLEDASRAHPIRHAILRYFNVAGADPQGRTGQSTPDATHLIKVACQAALGLRPGMEVFGTDWPTPDGTAQRDFIHVSDLVQAHLDAMDALRAGGPSATFNCGYGRGFSVHEVIEAVERHSNRKIALAHAPRRPGDAAVVLADATRIRQELGWTPRHDDLDTIVRSALEWERRLGEV